MYEYAAVTTSDPEFQEGAFHVNASPTLVFPLFTALGERSWVKGWNPEILSGREARGTVFKTQHGDRETTWIVVAFEPAEGAASYARLVSHSNFGLVDIRCTALSGGGTRVRVRYTLTALSDEGRVFVTSFLNPLSFGNKIGEWQTAIASALGSNLLN